jgi:hypothetical protein
LTVLSIAETRTPRRCSSEAMQLRGDAAPRRRSSEAMQLRGDEPRLRTNTARSRPGAVERILAALVERAPRSATMRPPSSRSCAGPRGNEGAVVATRRDYPDTGATFRGRRSGGDVQGATFRGRRSGGDVGVAALRRRQRCFSALRGATAAWRGDGRGYSSGYLSVTRMARWGQYCSAALALA